MEQPNGLQTQEASESTSKTYSVKVGTDVNGDPIMQTVTEDELLNGYLRQSDYTRKTQELAEERKRIDSQLNQAQQQGYQGDPSDDEAVEQYLQSKGYAKADYINQLVEEKLKGVSKQQQDEQTLQSIIQSNPDLKQFEGAIKKIASTDNSAIEDIIVKYGFSNPDKLSKAKNSRGLVGNSSKEESKSKPVSEWTKEDWAKFEATTGNRKFR